MIEINIQILNRQRKAVILKHFIELLMNGFVHPRDRNFYGCFKKSKFESFHDRNRQRGFGDHKIFTFHHMKRILGYNCPSGEEYFRSYDETFEKLHSEFENVITNTEQLIEERFGGGYIHNGQLIADLIKYELLDEQKKSTTMNVC